MALFSSYVIRGIMIDDSNKAARSRNNNRTTLTTAKLNNVKCWLFAMTVNRLCCVFRNKKNATL